MNRIRIDRMFLAGLVTFIVWIVIELIVEQALGRIVFGNLIQMEWLYALNVRNWSIVNHVLNISIALLNCTVLMWLYASLRPMFGVGTKTALIASAFGILLGLSMTVNGINLGLFPAKLGLVEIIYEAIEFPLAMIAGAMAYEGINVQIAS